VVKVEMDLEEEVEVVTAAEEVAAVDVEVVPAEVELDVSTAAKKDIIREIVKRNNLP
jgi:hypothetical protein